jgi:hypothetical protein
MMALGRRIVSRLAPGLMAERAVRWQFSHHPEADGEWEVEAGPFEGLRYPAGMGTVAAVDLKRQGLYEAPVAPLIAAALERATAFVDIGSAEGFYAVSAARMGVPTTAYEASRTQRAAISRLAAANDVSLEIRRACRTVPKAPPGAVCLMDVEGAEATLLDDGAARRLAATVVFVELHEEQVPGVTDQLLQRFRATHESQVVETEEPEAHRGPGRWAVFRPAPS